MLKYFVALGIVIALGVGLWFAFSDTNETLPAPLPGTGNPPEEAYVCDADAKVCPDGTAVGRQGPDCEFAACPSPAATSGTVTTYIDGSPTTLNVTVNPKEVVTDSRCPEGVQCIWAGEVKVRTVLSTQVSHGEHVMTPGAPQTFGAYTVTLLEVTPYPTAGEEIPVSAYRFTYEVKKN